MFTDIVNGMWDSTDDKIPNIELRLIFSILNNMMYERLQH